VPLDNDIDAALTGKIERRSPLSAGLFTPRRAKRHRRKTPGVLLEPYRTEPFMQAKLQIVKFNKRMN
jgi:hypothetical protein